MKKVLFSLFLSLTVLLLSGYGLVSAHHAQGDIGLPSDKTLSQSDQVNFASILRDRSFILQSPCSGTEKETGKVIIAENEIEEENLNHVRKYVESSSAFTAIIYALVLGYFFRYLKKRVSLRGRFSSFTSSRCYILFRVLRI